MRKAAEHLSRRDAGAATASAEQAVKALSDAKREVAQQTADMKKRLFNLARQSRLASTLPPEFVQALDHFVRQGRGLVIFPGDYMAGEPPGRKRGEPVAPLDPRAAPFQDYNDQLWAKHGLLPAKVNGLLDFPAPASPLRFNRDSLTLPAFHKFKEDDYYKDTSRIDVYRALAVDDPPRAASA